MISTSPFVKPIKNLFLFSESFGMGELFRIYFVRSKLDGTKKMLKNKFVTNTTHSHDIFRKLGEDFRLESHLVRKCNFFTKAAFVNCQLSELSLRFTNNTALENQQSSAKTESETPALNSIIVFVKTTY